MSKSISFNYSSEFVQDEESCPCQRQFYRMIKNYHSILDRTQATLCTWKLVHRNDQIRFTRSREYQQNAGALVIRVCCTYLIHPWYQYIDFSQHFHLILKKNSTPRVFEIVLLEYPKTEDRYDYQLAIVECPCRNRSHKLCEFCQLVLTSTEPYHTTNEKTQMTLGHEIPCKINDQRQLRISQENDAPPVTIRQSITSLKSKSLFQLALHVEALPLLTYVKDEKSKQSCSIEFLTKATQSKLHACHLPPSPLAVVSTARIESQTSKQTTRSCQINTLSYLIKCDEGSTEIQQVRELSWTTHSEKSSSTEFISKIESRSQKIELDRMDSNDSSMKRWNYVRRGIYHIKRDRLVSLSDSKTNDWNPMSTRASMKINLSQPAYPSSKSLKCINACENTDIDQLNFNSLVTSQQTNISSVININEQNIDDSQSLEMASNIILSESKSDEKESRISPPSSMLVELDQCHRLNTNKIDHKILFARVRGKSVAYERFQIIVNDQHTCLHKLIESQLTLTYKECSRSVSILIGDKILSEYFRFLFLYSIDQCLSKILLDIVGNPSIRVTCLTLSQFNNGLYDLLTLKRLRLIDTGKQIYLEPCSYEFPLRNSEDVSLAINRLNGQKLNDHRILIVNFYGKTNTISGSFLFVYLAPSTVDSSFNKNSNLNRTRYSVLKLVRQLKKYRLMGSNDDLRWSFNECLLNRLLKNYVYAPESSMLVFKLRSNRSITTPMPSLRSDEMLNQT